MADEKISIRWTQERWDPLAGCTRKSAACRHCYAEEWTAQNSQPGNWGHGFAENSADGPVWTQKVGLIEERLSIPFQWETPRIIFVNSLSDVFHESVDYATIDRIFAVMAMASQHIFQILTKRPKIMQNYMSDAAAKMRIENAMKQLALDSSGRLTPIEISAWPLPNVWLGVTAENQKEADRRVPLLLETPSAIRFIAAEPLLEQIDLKPGIWLKLDAAEEGGVAPKIDWIIAGGEVGTAAKRCDPSWARSMRDQCAKTGTAFFWSQWGAHAPSDSEAHGDSNHRIDGALFDAFPVPLPG